MAWTAGEPAFSERALPGLIPRHLVQDIDTEEDWRRAELRFAALGAEGHAPISE